MLRYNPLVLAMHFALKQQNYWDVPVSQYPRK